MNGKNQVIFIAISSYGKEWCVQVSTLDCCFSVRELGFKSPWEYQDKNPVSANLRGFLLQLNFHFTPRMRGGGNCCRLAVRNPLPRSCPPARRQLGRRDVAGMSSRPSGAVAGRETSTRRRAGPAFSDHRHLASGPVRRTAYWLAIWSNGE
jgi:hypothetical protein